MYHPTLTQEKWNKLSKVEQLGNIGSEISRAINWRKKNSLYMRESIYRGLELLDLSVNDPKNVISLKEILRLRECINDYFFGNNVYGSSDAVWNNYFLAYGVAARQVRQ